VALRDLRVRDDAWVRMAPAHLPLWTDVVRRAQPGRFVAPASLLALDPGRLVTAHGPYRCAIRRIYGDSEPQRVCYAVEAGLRFACRGAVGARKVSVDCM
jgi:hypothetical protein